jgi:hypothetical protein
VYRRVFDFWLKVFAVSFGMGVVTGVPLSRTSVLRVLRDCSELLTLGTFYRC